MSAPMYSLRAMRIVDGEWANVEVASAPDKRTAMALADTYSRTGTAVYVHKLQPPTTFWASSPDAVESSREETPPGRAVHHIDGNPANNDPDNLRIFDARDTR